jgi:hypothetical protein
MRVVAMTRRIGAVLAAQHNGEPFGGTGNAWSGQLVPGTYKTKTTKTKTIWLGALAFWIVVACLIAARVMFTDFSKHQSSFGLSGDKAALNFVMRQPSSERRSD